MSPSLTPALPDAFAGYIGPSAPWPVRTCSSSHSGETSDWSPDCQMPRNRRSEKIQKTSGWFCLTHPAVRSWSAIECTRIFRLRAASFSADRVWEAFQIAWASSRGPPQIVNHTTRGSGRSSTLMIHSLASESMPLPTLCGSPLWPSLMRAISSSRDG